MDHIFLVCYIDVAYVGAPAGDFARMVWGGRLFGSLFMADDLLDSGKMLGRIPGFKEAARGEGVSSIQYDSI